MGDILIAFVVVDKGLAAVALKQAGFWSVWPELPAADRAGLYAEMTFGRLFARTTNIVVLGR